MIPEFTRNVADRDRFNRSRNLPYELRITDFESAMQDVYDFFHDVNSHLLAQRTGAARRDAATGNHVRCAIRHADRKFGETLSSADREQLFQRTSRSCRPGRISENSVKAGTEGVEIKTTRKKGGAVDTHGARDQWMCVFVYIVDNDTEPVRDRSPMTFTEVYLAQVTTADFRRNPRSELGTRTATLDRHGVAKLRESWLYRL